ncbi:cell division protein FtsP [Morganella morganii]|uniref:cell division protein FtsP n=1 Tax=Morganella morganii TaxID=582 RepID=UPI003EBC7FBE
MTLSRRRFIQASGLAVCLGSLPLSVRAADEGGSQPLPVPPLLESRNGQPLFLTMQRTHWSFNGKTQASVWGFNGRYLGPTVRVRNGDDIKMIYSNRLSEPVAVNVSGLLVPGTVAGGAARLISPNTDWSPVSPVRQPAATCWYHANTPNRMAPHVYNGLAGMWIVDDEESRNLPLPKEYGVNDFPLIIQDKRLDSFGSPEYRTESDGMFIGDRLIVNGAEDPYLEVSKGWIRLRMVNAANARRFELKLSDGRPFYMIASDQGLLPSPVAVEVLSLSPGERREVLIDMSKTETLTITAGESATLTERFKSLFETSNTLVNTNVLTIRATGLISLVTDNLPTTLIQDPTQITTGVRNRDVSLSLSPPGINGAMWDMSRTDIRTQQGNWERWVVTTDTPQPFHISGVRFKVINHNGQSPQPQDYGWKDTVWIDGRSELLVQMMQPSYSHFPFFYYSQFLEQADRGVTGQLEIEPSSQY